MAESNESMEHGGGELASLTDGELLSLYLSEEPGKESWQVQYQLVTRCTKMILGHLARIATGKNQRMNHQDFEDLCQEILKKVFTGDNPIIRRLDIPTGGGLYSMLGVTATNAFYSKMRREMALKRPSLVPVDADILETLANVTIFQHFELSEADYEIARQAMFDTIAELPEKERRIIECHLEYGTRTNAERAAMLGMNPSSYVTA